MSRQHSAPKPSSITAQRSGSSTIELVNAIEQVKGKAGQITEILGRSNLLILDELRYLPYSASDGALSFNMLSELYERTIVAITTNLSFGEWATAIGVAKMPTALLTASLTTATS